MTPRTFKIILLVVLGPALLWALWLAPWHRVTHESRESVIALDADYRPSDDPVLVEWSIDSRPRLEILGNLRRPKDVVAWIRIADEEPSLQILRWRADGPPGDETLSCVLFEGGELYADVEGREPFDGDRSAALREARAVLRRARAEVELASRRGEITLPNWWPESDDVFVP